MIAGPALENLVAAVEDSCRDGLDLTALRAAVLPRLRRAVPIDALWWAAADPDTLLFTQAHREEIPEDAGPYFVENEFLCDDVNKWTDVARRPGRVRTLLQATEGRPAASARYRDVFRPLGLEDELRAVLGSRGTVRGFLCLHREAGTPFSAEEVALVRRLAAPLAEGMRLALLVEAVAAEQAPGPGLLLLAPDDSLAGANAVAEQWLDELRAPGDADLPIEVRAVAARLRAGAPCALRVRSRADRWAVLHASWLGDPERRQVAVIVEEASPEQLAPLFLDAHGLTERERTVAALVLRGLSTAEISGRLRISEHTVQDHLKAIFAKTGVRSRRDLVATVLRRR